MAESKTPQPSLPLGPPEVVTRNSFDASPSMTSDSLSERDSRNSRPRPIDRWMHRITVLLFVFLCAVIGVFLVILPWRPEWTDNRFFALYPTVRTILSSAFVRGICSGLGVLDVWIGFWEAIHYHDE